MKPQRLSLILSIAIALVLSLGGAGYYFGVQYLTAGTAHLRQVMTEGAQAEADLGSLQAAKRQYDRTIAPVVPLIDAALPRTKQQTEILAQIERLAQSTGLSLAGITLPSPSGLPGPTSQTTSANGALALPISFQLSGSYAQLQSFLSQLENLNRFTNVTTLAVSRPDPSKPITYSITLNAYIKP